MIVMLLAAVVCMEMIGFPLCNFLFLLLFMRIAGLKKKSHLLIISFLGTILLLYLFVKVVYLPLPKGNGFLTTSRFPFIGFCILFKECPLLETRP